MNIQERLSIINQQVKELVSLYRSAVAHSGVSENEFWIWYALTLMDGEYSQQDICGMWSLSKQTVNTIITHMTQKNYVTLEVVPGSRNRKLIRLTEAGRAYGESLVLPVFGAEQRALQRMPETDLEACTAAFRNYIQILKEELHEG